MNTHLTTEQFWSIIENKLSAKETDLLEKHIRKCPSCSSVFESIQLLHEDLASLKSEDTSPSLTDSVISIINQKHQAEKATQFWMTWTKRLIIGSSIFIITLLLTLFFMAEAPSSKDLIAFEQFTFVIGTCCLLVWIFYLSDQLFYRYSRPSQQH